MLFRILLKQKSLLSFTLFFICSHQHGSCLLYSELLYSGYNSILCYLLYLSTCSILAIEFTFTLTSVSFGCAPVLLFAFLVCFALFCFCFFLSESTSCSGLILCFSCPRCKISDLSKEPCFLLLENYT